MRVRAVMLTGILLSLFSLSNPSIRAAELEVADNCPGATPLGPSVMITVSGTASGAGWSWCINGPNYSICNPNLAGPAAGSSAAQIAQAITASINLAGCQGLVAQVVADSIISIRSSCLKDYMFCIGEVNSSEQCCVSCEAPGVCSVDATFSQLAFCDYGLACGDVDGNFIVTISDAVMLVNYIFAGGQISQLVPANADGDCFVSISDAVYLINYIFAGGPAPSGCW